MNCYGISLGTSLSNIAAVSDGNITVLKSATSLSSAALNDYSVTTSIYIDENNNISLGQAADNNRYIDPSRYKSNFIYDIGTDLKYNIYNKGISTEDIIQKFILYFLKLIKNNPNETSKIAISYPVDFSKNKINSYKKIIENVGIHNYELLDEAIAVAMYYDSKHSFKIGDKLLVYDLGGSSFKLSLLVKDSFGFRHISNPLSMDNCGGICFDRKIYNNIIESLDIHSSLDTFQKKLTQRRYIFDLEEKCIKLKHQLSFQKETCSFIYIPNTNEYKQYFLSQFKLKSLINKELSLTSALIAQILNNSGIKPIEIDYILLAGGSTNLPFINSYIESVVQKPIIKDLAPELIICSGSAIAAFSSTIKDTNVDSIVNFDTDSDDLINKILNQSNTDSKKIIVDASGNGDYTSIQEAINSAFPNYTIFIREGIYKESIIINKPLKLQGEGIQKTIVNSTFSNTLEASNINGGEIKDITFTYTGIEQYASTIKLSNCNLTLTSCLIKNESYCGVEIKGGSPSILNSIINNNTTCGCMILDDSTAILRNNTICNNTGSGIFISGYNTKPEVTNNKICENERFGITIQSGSKGLIKQNTISENGLSGIGIGGLKTSPEIICNSIFSNTQVGIVVFQSALGLIKENSIYENNMSGIYVTNDDTNPKIEANRIELNKQTGIKLCSGAHSSIINNIICKNELSGILVEDTNSNSNILNNKIFSNHEFGVFFKDGANGYINKNEIYENSLTGILVKDNSTTVNILDNLIYKNKQTGIGIFKMAQTEVKSNQIYNNELSGIYISDINTSPDILNNKIFKNSEFGVALKEGSGGNLNNNEIYNNALSGILIRDSNTAPNIISNKLKANGETGIFICLGALGNIAFNEINENHMSGVLIKDLKTSPVVKDNKITSNKQNGIYIFNQSTCTIKNNTIARNYSIGIEVSDNNTCPIIINNVISENKGQGIYEHDGAKSILSNNTITESWLKRIFN